MQLTTPRLIITTFSPDMAQSVYENLQDDDTRRFVPDEVYESALWKIQPLCESWKNAGLFRFIMGLETIRETKQRL